MKGHQYAVRFRWIIFSALFPLFAFGQTNASQSIDSLRFVTDMPYICEGNTGCGDQHFWAVVKQRKPIIPLLIDRLVDTTETEVFVPNFGGLYTVGDVSFVALKEIIHGITTFKLLGVKFDKHGCGYCSFWQHLRTDYRNRLRFQAKVRRWYDKNEKHFVWVESNEFSTCDCFGKHPNGGHFELTKK